MSIVERPFRALMVALCLSLGSAGAYAQQVKEVTVEVAGSKDTVDEGAKKASVKSKKDRFRYCYCARPRIYRDKKEVVLDELQSVSAWTEPKRVDFAAVEREKDEDTLRTRSVAAPFAVEYFDVSAHGTPAPSRSALTRAYATSAYREPFLFGLMKPKVSQALDLVRARIGLEPGNRYQPSSGTPPRLERLFISPYRQRDIPSCGESNTHRVHYQLQENSPAIAGFLVKDQQGRAALLDERHVRSFGIGKVAPCEQGLDIAPSGTYSIAPVGWDFAVGESVVFNAEQEGMQPVIAKLSEGLDNDDEQNPFVNPPKDPIEKILNNDSDTIALGAILFAIFGAFGFAGVLRQAIRNRKEMVDVTCPSCEKTSSLNARDPATDGMFCPNCGKSSMFVTFEPDGSTRVRAFKLDEAAPANDAPKKQG